MWKLNNSRDSEKLESLGEELTDLMKKWRGTGIEQQRREAIKIEQARLRTAIADRVRMYYDVDHSREKISDGRPVAEAPDATSPAELHFSPHRPAEEFQAQRCPVCNERFDEVEMPHGHTLIQATPVQVYYRPASMEEEDRRKVVALSLTEKDLALLRDMKITLDEPTPSGKM